MALDEPDRASARDPVADADDRLALTHAVRALPPRARRLVALCYFADLSQAEAAAAMGISRVHASRLLGEALATLRHALSESSPRPDGEAAVASARARG